MSRNALAFFNSAAGAALSGTLGVDPAGGGGCFIDSIGVMIFGGVAWGAQNISISNILAQSSGGSQTYFLFIPNGTGSASFFWNFDPPLPYSPVLGATITAAGNAGLAWEVMVQAHFGKASRRGGLY
jgi:hypothetical protein